MKNTAMSKRFRYGSVATALTAVFIALVVILNVIITAVSGKFGWYADMTGNELYTLSDSAKSIMSEISADVKIIFAEEKDVLKSSATTNYIYTTATQIAEAFPNVTVECHDIISENVFFERYKSMASSDITATTVIIESGDEFAVCPAKNFYILDEDDTVWAYNGEYRFLSSILQVTASEKPVVYFTTGHGEDITGAATLIATFRDSGFDVKPIDLSKEEISEDARIIVVYNPLYDFIGIEAEDDKSNEINKVDAFLDSIHHGCLMTFIDYEAVEALTNLNEFLEEWGIKYEANTVIRDYNNSTTVDGRTIVAEFNSNEDDFAVALYEDILSMSTLPKAIVKNATPIDILFTSGGDVGSNRYVSTLFTSSATSEKIKNGATVGDGAANVMTVSVESRIYNNSRYYSYVIAGSPSFASSTYLLSNSYANRDVITSAMRLTGRERVLADIDFKVFDDTELTITTAQANGWTVALTAVLPLVIAMIGVAVWLRRKHS